MPRPEPQLQVETAMDFSAIPLPAGVIGGNSDTFDGTILFEGRPLATSPAGALGSIDTVIRRLADSEPLGINQVDTVPVKMLALRMRSPAPVVFSFNGGQLLKAVDVELSLAPGVVQPGGSMTIVRDSADGGSFSYDLEVVVALRLFD